MHHLTQVLGTYTFSTGIPAHIAASLDPLRVREHLSQTSLFKEHQKEKKAPSSEGTRLPRQRRCVIYSEMKSVQCTGWFRTRYASRSLQFLHTEIKLQRNCLLSVNLRGGHFSEVGLLGSTLVRLLKKFLPFSYRKDWLVRPFPVQVCKIVTLMCLFNKTWQCFVSYAMPQKADSKGT